MVSVNNNSYTRKAGLSRFTKMRVHIHNYIRYIRSVLKTAEIFDQFNLFRFGSISMIFLLCASVIILWYFSPPAEQYKYNSPV